MSASNSALHEKSASSLRKALIALPLCAVFALTSAATESRADPVAGGIAGAIGGALIGGAVGGKKGAGRGALIGLGVGAAAGAIKEQERRKRRAKRKRVYKKKYTRRAPAHAPAPAYGPAYEETLVFETQLELQRLGYNPGPVDGLYGPQTADALATYQDDYALPVTGEPTLELLDHMRKHEG